jgi:hypothetical protein
MVDWARASGFHVVAAGKGTEYLPAYHDVTPAGVWRHYGLTAGEAQPAGMNPQMFNSFLDGTKSAIEMAAIANATGLDVPTGGLLFPPYGVDDLPHVMRPRDKGGGLEKSGEADLEGVPIPSGSSSIPCQCISQASPIPWCWPCRGRMLAICIVSQKGSDNHRTLCAINFDAFA